MSWLLVLFWSSLAVKVSSNYRVVEDTPDMSCSLATPEIEFGEFHNKVILNDSLLDTWQEARIGYVEALVELQYIGCIRLRDINGIYHVSVSTSLDVGQCYSACDNYTLIGLTSRGQGDACLCFGNDIKGLNRKHDKCSARCGSFVCGSKGHVSLYQKVNIDIEVSRENTKSDGCLGLTKKGYTWLDCDETLDYTACVTDTDDFKEPSSLLDYLFYVILTSMTWLDGVENCFENEKYPMPFRKDGPIAVSWKENHWTGVLQTIAICKVDALNSVKAYGYVVISDDGGYVLEFDESSNLTSRLICVDEMVSSSTEKPGTSHSPESSHTSPSTSTDADTTSPLRSTQTSTSTTLTHENTSITDTSAEDHITTTTTKITTAMSTENKHITESMGSPYGDKTEEESSVGLSIGLPVAALLLVGIGVVVFVLWKRRRKPLKEKETPSSLQNNVIYQNNNAMIAHTNNAYEEVDQPSDVLNDQANVYDHCKDEDKDSQHEYGNSYFVLEKAKEGTEYSEVSKAREKKPEYSEVSKAHDNKTESNDNAYFVLEKEEKTPDPDDTGYGSSNSGNLKSKGASNVPDRHVYSTAGSANTINNPYDEYDHIGRTSGRALTESNLYDSTFANKPTDTTYDSTLLNTSAKRNKTDAIYDKANNAANNVYANIGDN